MSERIRILEEGALSGEPHSDESSGLPHFAIPDSPDLRPP
jgi:hypothetical protein